MLALLLLSSCNDDQIIGEERVFIVESTTTDWPRNEYRAITRTYAVTVSGASGPLAHAEAGAAIQSVMLAATAAGFGSCWLGAFDRDKVKAILGIGAESELLYLVAFGQPAENPVTDEITDKNGVNYYLDSNDVLHVPKLALNKLVEFV